METNGKKGSHIPPQSISEAKRLIDAGAVRIDGVKLKPNEYYVDFDRINGAVVQIGKRYFVRAKIVRKTP